MPQGSRKVVRPRRLEIGATCNRGKGVHFRVWAPARKSVTVILEQGPGAGDSVPLTPGDDGYFAGLVPKARNGSRFRYLLDEEGPYPDPASRWQPDGPFGPSQVVDPRTYTWSDDRWAGPELAGAVFYELHPGTFTPEGTWSAAMDYLPSLADLGVTVIELMPVADFPGAFGWSYDGVNLFAPSRWYGEPDSLRRFVDRAHSVGLAVILDVNYNHPGPVGNFLARYSPDYDSDRHRTEWGPSYNFDGRDSDPVRSFILANAAYWVEDFHMDGLRLDATQSLLDDSDDHIIAAIARRVREAATGRRTLIVGENEPQDSRILRKTEEGGFGLDAVWLDDFHHVARVAATGRREGYYSDYLGTPQEFVSTCRRGYLWQGQWNARQGKSRGTSSIGIERTRFVYYLQNHDQVANSARGDRFHQITSPGHYRTLTAISLLASGSALLFQGQEFAASSPFVYFSDVGSDLAEKMYEGRKSFLRQFASLAGPEMQDRVPRPHEPEMFARCKLDHTERERHFEAYALHVDLLKIRRECRLYLAEIDGAVLGPEAFALRFFNGEPGEMLFLANLGADMKLKPPSEPLLAPPSGRNGWKLFWSSENPRYRGGGIPPLACEGEDGWRIPGRSAMLLKPGDPGVGSR